MTSAKGPTLAVVPSGKGEGAQVLQPSGWPMPKGYANGMAAEGRIVVTGGVIGWDADERLADGFVAQVRQCILAVMPVFPVDLDAFGFRNRDVFGFRDAH